MPKLTASAVALAIAAMLAAGSAAAQQPLTGGVTPGAVQEAPRPLRTADGKPNFSGTWSNASLTPLSRGRGQTSLVVSEAEARRIAGGTAVAGVAPEQAGNENYVDPNAPAPPPGGSDFGLKGYNSFWVTPGDNLAYVHGEFRTSNIVEPANGQLPYRDPAGIARSRQAGGVRYVTGVGGNAGPEDTNLAERCLIGFSGTGGPGMLSALYNNNYEFVQTPTHLMILVEMAHDARIVPIFASQAEAQRGHKPAAITPWLGDSVAWWEGDTLAIETINVNPEQGRAHPFALSPAGKVTERLSRDGRDIFYSFTVDDPAIYTQAWRAELAFRPIEGHVYEYACHEGNYAMPHMLAGQRLLDAQAAARPQPAAQRTTRR
jgi:hypothetical protein